MASSASAATAQQSYFEALLDLTGTPSGLYEILEPLDISGQPFPVRNSISHVYTILALAATSTLCLFFILTAVHYTLQQSTLEQFEQVAAIPEVRSWYDVFERPCRIFTLVTRSTPMLLPGERTDTKARHRVYCPFRIR